MEKRRSKYTPGTFALRVRRSATGYGLFTEEEIPKDVCIIEYIGKPVSKEVALKDKGKYFFDVMPGKTIDGNISANLARYINHSCLGNCETRGPRDRIFIFSRKRIPAGAELTYDYGKEYFDKHIKPKGCKCPLCLRGT